MPRKTAQVLVSTALFIAVPTAVPHAGDEPRIEGVYSWRGQHIDGSRVNGFVRIVRHGESFLLAWMLAQDDPLPIAVGAGVTDGGMLAVVFYGALTEGVAIYRIEEGGRRLIGRWVKTAGDGTVHPDLLIRVQDDEPRLP